MKRYPLYKNLLLSFASILVFFSLLEGATRLFWHSKLEKDHVGAIIQGANRQIIYEGIEYKTNSLGLRMTRELSPRKSANEKRILAVGDSFVWGEGLPYEDLITVKMEALLNRDYGEVQVINGGQSGFDTIDELERLKLLMPLCQPDMAIIFFYTNDVVGKNDKHSFNLRQNTHEFLRTHSKFLGFLYYLFKDKLGIPTVFLPSDLFDLNDSKPGWVAFKKAATEIHRECSENNVQLLFVLIPTLTNLDANYPYAELRTKTNSFLKGIGIPVYDIFDLFTPYRASELWISLKNTHWNGKGTDLAAAGIVDCINTHNLLRN